MEMKIVEMLHLALEPVGIFLGNTSAKCELEASSQKRNGTHWFTNSQCALFLCSTPLDCYIGGDIIAVRHFSMYNMVKRKDIKIIYRDVPNRNPVWYNAEKLRRKIP